MPKIDIWMPWYIAEYQADTAHLNPPQDSAYRRLLEYQWKTRRPLPNDILALIQITRMSPFFVDASSIPQECLMQASSIGRASASKDERELYAWILDLLQQFFSQNQDGTWSQLRLEKELSKWGNKNEIAIEKAKNAAWNRWHGPNSADPKPRPPEPKSSAKGGDASSITRAQPEQSPSPSPGSTKAKYPRTFGAGFDRNRNGAPASPKSPNSSSQPVAKGRRNPASSQHRAGGAAGSGGRGKGGRAPVDAAKVPKKSIATGKKPAQQPPKTRNEVDRRFAPFREEVFRYWGEIHKAAIAAGRMTRVPPWGMRERAEMTLFLRSAPSITLQQFGHMLMQRAGSQVNHAQPPYLWLKHLFSFAAGQVDRYGLPLEGKKR